MDKELRKIKKLYGEKFARFCREFFHTILETQGQLLNILTTAFVPNHFLYDDIMSQGKKENFINYIYHFYERDKMAKEINITKTPEELLDSVGYNLYKCETFEDTLKFEKYYAIGESLCTFRDPKRTQTHDVFFAVKKDIDQIHRKDFYMPQRQNGYGTSIISIQFSKTSHLISIKNRYNHSVDKCDATFSNDLDNIVFGLSASFAKFYGLKYINKSGELTLRGYVSDFSGKMYKYNYFIDNVYYCTNNCIIIDGKVDVIDKSKCEIFDYFAYDKKKKIIGTIMIEDAFIDAFSDYQKIYIVKHPSKKERVFTVFKQDGTYFSFNVDANNNIVSYTNNFIKQIGDSFLCYNKYLREINLPNVETIGNDFLKNNENLTSFYAPKLVSIANGFLKYNNNLKNFEANNLQQIGNGFLKYNKELKTINLPNVVEIGDYFLSANRVLEEATLPKLTVLGGFFLSDNREVTSVNFPNLRVIGGFFLSHNRKINSINLPNAVYVGNNFLENNICLSFVSLPNVKKIEDGFLRGNTAIDLVSLPNVKYIGDYFLEENAKLSQINLPNVKEIGIMFLYYNDCIKKVVMQNVEKVGESFLERNNNAIDLVDMPNLKETGDYFLARAKDIKKINFRKDIIKGEDFLRDYFASKKKNKNLTLIENKDYY